MSVQQIQRLFFVLLMLFITVNAQGILGADGTASGTVLLAHGGELPPMMAFNNAPSAYSPYGFFG